MRRTLFLMALGCMSLCGFAQIAIRTTAIVEKAVVKPQVFDSLANLVLQKRFIDYKKYVGYQLFFLPQAQNYSSKNRSQLPPNTINCLFTDNSTEIVKDGRIPFENLGIAKMYGNPKQLSGDALNQYKKIKKEYETNDKVITNVYMPKFYLQSIDSWSGEIKGTIATPLDSVVGKYFTILDILI